MPSLEEYVTAVMNYDYDFLNKIPEDDSIINVSLGDFIWNAYVLLSASKEDMFRYLLEMFEDININDDLHIMNLIALDNRSNLGVFRSLRLYYPELSIVELISQWTSQSFNDQVALAIDKLIRIFGVPEYEVLKEMLYILETNQQYDFYNYIFAFASEISDFAPIPDYIKTDRIVTEQDLNVKFQELVNNITPISQEGLAEEVYNSISQYSNDITLEKMERLISQANIQEQHTLANAIAIMNHKDSDAIPYFGPANPIQFSLSGWDENNIDTYVTSERMLLCDFYDHDENGEDIEWYTGSCDKCGFRIRNICHCVRMPVISGGWEGCFCSWKCTTDYTESSYYDDSILINDLIALYSKQLSEHGMYEREN